MDRVSFRRDESLVALLGLTIADFPSPSIVSLTIPTTALLLLGRELSISKIW